MERTPTETTATSEEWLAGLSDEALDAYLEAFSKERARRRAIQMKRDWDAIEAEEQGKA